MRATGCLCLHFMGLAGDAEALRSLQVYHAGGQPGSTGNPRTAGKTGQDEPKLEPSVYRPPAVGHHSEEDSDALPGEKRRVLWHFQIKT